jgi:hypothetical protein
VSLKFCSICGRATVRDSGICTVCANQPAEVYVPKADEADSIDSLRARQAEAHLMGVIAGLERYVSDLERDLSVNRKEVERLEADNARMRETLNAKP